MANQRCIMWLAVVGMVCCRAAGQTTPDVPDRSIMLALAPAAAEAGPPPIIKPGTRLVYFGMAASIPGERRQLVLDENGQWVDQQTGQRYGEQEIPGAGGAGFNVIQVGYVDHNLVQLSTKLYLYDPARRQSMYSSGSGLVAHSGCAADYWIHPAVLNQVAEVNQPDMRILRMPYRLNNRVYNAIRFQTTNARGYQAYVYDLETGLMIFHGSRTEGAAVLTPPVAGSQQAGVGQGSTQLVTGWIVEVRDIDVPWKDQVAPPWLREFRELNYQGVQSSMVMGAGTHQRAMQLTIRPLQRASGWLRYEAATVIQTFAGMPPEQAQWVGACGPATIGGLWISPQELARLHPGQILDRNEHVGAVTSVSAADGMSVTLSEVGPLHRIDFAYDVASGVLLSMNLQQQIGLGLISHQLRLVNRP